MWKRALDDMSARNGHAQIVDLRANHIEKDLADRSPHPANNRLKAWRALTRWWRQEGLHSIDPAREISKRKTPKTDGHETWSLEDLASFRERWPIGTQQRVACEVIHYFGARVSDAFRLGPGMIRDGWLTYQTKKTGVEVAIPVYDPPPFAEAPLLEAIDPLPRHTVFLTTVQGKSRSIEGARQWFARAAPHLPGHKTAHGLRKLRLVTMAEKGATASQLQVWVGHLSLEETALYTRAVENKRILSFPTSSPKVPTIEIYKILSEA